MKTRDMGISQLVRRIHEIPELGFRKRSGGVTAS
jgi:hypothetical protein